MERVPPSDAPALLGTAYVSSATRPLSDADLADLLAACWQANRAAGVTGMLVYRDGLFLQVIEGAPAVVRALMDRIRRDPRHRDVTTFYEQPLAERDFAGWAMAFAHAKLLQHPGALPLLDALADPVGLTAHPGRARALLLGFRAWAR